MRHLDGGHRGVVTLVAVLAAGAVERLFQRVGGEHAESDGNSDFERDVLQSARAFGSDEIEMRSIATDDGAQSDDGVKAVGVGQQLGGERELEGAGDVMDFEGGGFRFGESLASAVEQFRSDVGIETRDDDSEVFVSRSMAVAVRRTLAAPVWGLFGHRGIIEFPR